MPVKFTQGDLTTASGLERVLRQFEEAIGNIAVPISPAPSKLPLPAVVSSSSGGGGGGGGTPVIVLPELTLIATHAARIGGAYNPNNYNEGRQFFESDRTTLYVLEIVSMVKLWRLVGGVYESTFANRPSDLTTNDASFLFYATDQSTMYTWTGAAWDTVSVYALAALTANALILGAGTRQVAPLGSLGTTTTLLHGNAAGAPTWATVVEADQTLANNTTWNVSTTAHGYAPILPNDATKYLDGTGAYTTPTISANQTLVGIEVVIDGGGATITTGIKVDIEIPFACTINRVTMLADQSGSIVVDIWKDTYANYPPVVGDSITASAKPTITTALKSQDSTLTGWTTSITAGDTLRFNVDSVTTIQRVLVSLKVTKT